jgi:hypothetical protein
MHDYSPPPHAHILYSLCCYCLCRLCCCSHYSLFTAVDLDDCVSRRLTRTRTRTLLIVLLSVTHICLTLSLSSSVVILLTHSHALLLSSHLLIVTFVDCIHPITRTSYSSLLTFVFACVLSRSPYTNTYPSYSIHQSHSPMQISTIN